MFVWLFLSSVVRAAPPIKATLSVQCTDSIQLPLMAERLVLPKVLHGTLDWSPSEFQRAVDRHQPVQLDFKQAGEWWAISLDVGAQPDIPTLVSSFFPRAEVLDGPADSFKVFAAQGQFEGRHEDGYVHIFNDPKALDIQASGRFSQSTEAGCGVAWTNLPSAISKINGADVALFLPYSLSAVQAKFRHPELLLPDLNHSDLSVLTPVKTNRQPIAVLQLRNSPIELLRDDNMPASIRISDWNYALLHHKLRIPGVQIGLFTLNKAEPDLLAVVPITKKSKEKPVNDRRIWRWLKKFAKKSGWDLIEESDFSGELRQGDVVLYLRAVEGELHLSTQKERLHSIDPDGQAWKVSQAIQNQPLQLSVNLPQMMALGLGGVSQIQLGLTIQENTALAALSASSLNGQSGLVPLLAVAGQRLPLDQGEAEDADKSSEDVLALMREIALHVHRLFIETGAYPTMDKYPSRADGHAGETILPEQVSSIGWKPSRPTAAQFWVETTNAGKGFLIHGLLPRSSGETTHWVMDEQGKTWTLTPVE